ncbi:LCP family protein [Peterkaempfera griseoplana]|uniref:LCP family protein n=1 Tax=Peterkaempfera griseoplana TaxID=66896 RepID=UPI0006E454B8|nr:LCP family protein [Peterkaempfera griseoplana]
MTGSADRRGPGGDDWSAGRYAPAEQQNQEGWDDPGNWSPGAHGGPAPRQQGGHAQQQGYADPYGTGQYPAVDPYGGGYGTGQQGGGQQPYDTGGYSTGQYPQYPQYPQQGHQDPYGTGQGGGQQPYDTGGYPTAQYAQPQQQGYADPYGTGQYPVAGPHTGQQPVVPAQQPGRPVPPPRQQQGGQQQGVPQQGGQGPAARRGAPGQGAPGARPPGYEGEEFTFVDDEEESEDVIDWLKFAETRTERRDERKRRYRNRIVALVVVLVLAAAGGVGYLWKTGALGGDSAGAVPGGKRAVVVVHLHDLKGKTTTALLVDDAAGGKGSALLLPGTLLLPDDGGDSGTTTLGSSLDDQGAGGTQDALTTVLGAPISGTWRLDTPYLQILVDQLGGITLDTDTSVVAGGRTVVNAGKSQDLNGTAAVAYATYQGRTEQPAAQQARFGQVLTAVLKAMPTDASSATDVVKRMNAVMDPSLSERQLGASLAALARHAGAGHFSVATLPVKADGTVDPATAGTLVKQVLGGTVHNADSGSGPARVVIQNGTGTTAKADQAQIQVVNGGYTFVPPLGKALAPVARTQIRYTDDARAEAARQLALTLNVPTTAVKKVTGGQTADILVVLGQDYKGTAKPTQ